MIKDYKDIAGCILAGGKSSRMGHPKELLSVNGKRMIDKVLDVFYPLFEEIFIVTDDKNRFPGFEGVKVIEDLAKGYGPLAGIYTGLKAVSCDKAFFVACDMPFLHNGLIKRLLDSAMEGNYDCIVPRSSKGIEPLHAVYSRKIMQTIEDLLKGKDLSIRQMLRRCRCKYIDVDKEELLSLLNVNTPEDLKGIKTYAS